jgi:hypothetical protein
MLLTLQEDQGIVYFSSGIDFFYFSKTFDLFRRGWPVKQLPHAAIVAIANGNRFFGSNFRFFIIKWRFRKMRCLGSASPAISTESHSIFESMVSSPSRILISFSSPKCFTRFLPEPLLQGPYLRGCSGCRIITEKQQSNRKRAAAYKSQNFDSGRVLDMGFNQIFISGI